MTEKQIKAAIKEGGKKGQDIAGIYDMGGLEFYHISLENCLGNMDLVKKAMEGANRVVDEDADDRKGGSGHCAKTFLSANDDQVAVVCYMPKAIQEAKSVTPKDWVEVYLSNYDGELVSEEEEMVCVVFPKNKEKERFPLKMRDEAINLGYAWLVKKGFVLDDDDESDPGMDAAALEEAGIEW
jgi:lysyl-tRNA synthetase class 2